MAFNLRDWQNGYILASFRPVSAITSIVEMLQQSPYNKLTEIPRKGCLDSHQSDS